MNEYQEALNSLIIIIEMNVSYNNIYTDKKVLQELIDLHTPMKLIQDAPGQPPTCDNCYNEYPSKDAHYCPNCGQKIDEKKNHLLDWSE